MKKRCIITGIAGIVCACACIAFGGTLLEVDFNSLATGEIDNGGPTTAQLNSATTGGSWSLSANANLTHEIQDDGGDKAFKSNYPAGPDGSFMTFFSINLDTAIDIAAMTSDLTISFEFAPDEGTTATRDIQFQFVDSDGSTVLFYVEIDEGLPSLDGSTGGGYAGWTGDNVLPSWVEDHDDVGVITIVIDNQGNVNLDVSVNGNDYSDTSSFTASGAELDEIRVRADPDKWRGQGIYMNDVLIESGEPPGSVFRFR